MPTYQYECEKCGKEFEVFQSMKADALEICPAEHCGQKRWGRGRVRRQLGSGAGLIFKGSGFYITDYRSENYKSAAKKESSGGSTPSPGTGKADATPTPGAKTSASTKSEAPKSPAPKPS